MGYRQPESKKTCAWVWTHFALSQAELADFLGVSRALLANVEAGRRNLPYPALGRLFVLIRWLPAPTGEGPTAPDFAAEPAAPADQPNLDELDYRRRCVRFAISGIELELQGRGQRQQTYARRHWALQVLRTGLATTAAPTEPALLKTWQMATPNPDDDLLWLRLLAKDAADAPEPLSTTERALRTARLRGLEAELAALDALLGEEKP